jgi:exodeoxyribonuclease-5
LEYPYKIIVVDEVSMIPVDMWVLLLSHGVHVIALGDPFQLPPIDGESKILSHPHVFLDEIVRQAQDSEIIRLSMDIRAGLPLVKHKGNEVSVVSKHQLNEAYYSGADQIIAAKNITRANINWKCRKIKFGPDIPDYPVEGEKVICLKNYWNIMSTQGEPLINGMIGSLSNISYKDSFLFNDLFDKEMISDFSIEENNKFQSLFMDYKLFTDGKQTINSENWQKYRGVPKPLLFDYGYCITCHKSQGSEWGNVLVFDEYMKGTDHARWLYTAATRSKKKLIIVSDY